MRESAIGGFNRKHVDGQLDGAQTANLELSHLSPECRASWVAAADDLLK
jgi:hypothetical protein